MLGLNPLEQEIMDLTNEIAKNGFIYFPAFCQTVLKKYRNFVQKFGSHVAIKGNRIKGIYCYTMVPQLEPNRTRNLKGR